MDQKLNENPQKATARVHTVKPTPISLKGLTLQRSSNHRDYKTLAREISFTIPSIVGKRKCPREYF